MNRRQYLTALAALTGAALIESGCGGVSSDPPSEAVGEPGDAIAPEEAGDGATRALSNGRKGVQAVLLSRWSNASVGNFAGVVERSDAPGEFEIGFAPHFNDANPYGNALALADRLGSAGKRITFAVFLSFHSDASQANLVQRTVRFNEQFLRPLTRSAHAARFNVKLLPSLEDTWSLTAHKTFLDRATAMAAALDWNLVGSLDLRRSALGRISTLPSTLRVTRTVNRRQESRTFTLQREYHAYLKDAGSHQAYSNDGVFVWLDRPGPNSFRETERSADNADPRSQKTKIQLSEFVRGIDGVSASLPNAFLLWRPAYNLFARQRQANGGVFYAKAGAPSTRSDSNADPAFGATEIDVLEQYLKIPRR